MPSRRTFVTTRTRQERSSTFFNHVGSWDAAKQGFSSATTHLWKASAMSPRIVPGGSGPVHSVTRPASELFHRGPRQRSTRDPPHHAVGGDRLKVYTYSEARQKLSSVLDRAKQPLRFLLGGEQVINGLDEGVTGMRVGERRMMIVAPALSRRSTYPEGFRPKTNSTTTWSWWESSRPQRRPLGASARVDDKQDRDADKGRASRALPTWRRNPATRTAHLGEDLRSR